MSLQKIQLINYAPLIIAAIVVAIFYPSFEALMSLWMIWDQSMSHGIPVALLFLFLVARSLPWQVQDAALVERISVGVLIAVLSICWALFYFIKIKILYEMLVLPLYISALTFVFGFRTIWQYRMLLLLPVYIIPVWDLMNDQLVHLSSYVVSGLVQAVGMPAFIDGNSIHIPSGRIIISQGCSGLRYLVISLCLAHTIAYLNGYKEKGIIACLLIAALLGLIANWLRIFILICVGYVTEMRSSLMADHDTFGWLLFGGICLVAIYFAPIVKTSKVTQGQPADWKAIKPVTSLVLLVLLGSGPAFIYFTSMKKIAPLAAIEIDQTKYSISAQPVLVPPRFPKGSAVHTYKAPNDIFIRLDEYVPMTTHSQLVPYIPHLYDEDIWRANVSRQISIKEGPATWKVFRDKVDGRRIGQVQWFNVGGYQTASINKAKLYQIPAVIEGKIYFKIVTLQTVCNTDTCEDAYQALVNESHAPQWH